MDLINSPDEEEQDKNKDIENQTSLLSVINASTIIIIFLFIGVYAVQKNKSLILGIAAVALCLLYGILLLLQHKRTQYLSKIADKSTETTVKTKFIPNLVYIFQYLILWKHLEIIFFSVAASLYIFIFELMIRYHEEEQQAIILSLILSGFMNIQSVKAQNRWISFGFLTAVQIYTILKVQLEYSIDSYSLTLNILLLIYEITFLKTTFSEKKQLNINQHNNNSKIELTMRLYQSILSIIPEGIAVINSEKKLLYANPTLKKILKSNSKNDIQNILMNMGNNKDSTSLNNNKSKYGTHTPLEISSKIQNKDGIFLVKPQSSKQINQKTQGEQLQDPDIHAQQISDQIEVRIQQENRVSSASTGVPVKKQQDTIQCTQCKSIAVFKGSLTDNALDEKLNQQQQEILEESSLIYDKEQESSGDFIKEAKQYPNSQQQDEVRDSDSNLFPKQNAQMNPIQIKSLQTIYSQKGKPKMSNPSLEISAKVKTIVNISNSVKNTWSNNLQGTENSEILSYQGFGFCLQEEDLSILNQLPQVNGPKQKSEHNSVKANVDQDSVITFSTPQHTRSYSSGPAGILKRSLKFNQKQYQQSDEPLMSSQSNQTESLPQLPNLDNSERQTKNNTSTNNNNNKNLNPHVYNNGINQQFHIQHQGIYQGGQQKNGRFVQMELNIKNKSVQQQQGTHLGISNNNNSRRRSSEISNGFMLKLKSKNNNHISSEKENQIVTKKTDVTDILNTIFKGSQKKCNSQSIILPQLPNPKAKSDTEIKGFSSKKQEFDQEKTKAELLSNPQVLNRTDNRKSSFTDELKKQKDDELNYLQESDNIIKLQVKYQNKDLVLQFLSADYLADNLQNDTLVLVIVQDMWKELLQKKLQELQKDKMKIFGSLSHELRTPLNCSISMLEVLRDELQFTNPSYIEEYLNPALFSNRLLLNQINDILDFVQMDSGKFKYSFFDFSMMGLLKDCQKLISMQAQMKGIELKIAIESNIPETINSDPNRIRQILLNFLSNSLKFTKKGSIELGFKRSESNDMYQLYVKDTGIGITQENLKTIFSFCAKVNYEKQDEGLNNQGCGLGLTISNSIAKGLVNKANKFGGITVDSVYGEGSTFSIIIQDMRPTDEEAIKERINQLNKQASNQRAHKQSNVSSKEEDQIKQKNDCSILMNSQKSQSSYNASPTKLIGKRKQLNLINLSQIIFEDDYSYTADTPSKIADPHKLTQYGCKKQSTFNIQNKRIMEESNTPTGLQDRLFQQTNTTQRIDSSAVVEDESEYITKQYAQPHQFVQHHHNHSRFQEDLSCRSMGRKQIKVNSPSFSTSVVRHLENFSSTTNDFLRQGKTDTFSRNITDENPQSSKIIDNSAVYLFEDGKEQKIVSAVSIEARKEQPINNSKSNIRIQTINSFKTQNTDHFDKQKSFQEQEGFTSYIAFNRFADSYQPQSSVLIEKYSIYSPIVQNCGGGGQIELNLIDEKILHGKEPDIFNINPVEIINQIISQNMQKKQACNCPQIVIVDDNQFNLYALSKMIQQFSFKCQQISDGVQALEDLKKLFENSCCKAPKIIFLDIEMPFKNGYEVAAELTEYYKRVELQQLPVIIACTAYVGQEDRQRALDSGMDDFINKPILKSAFQQLLLNWSTLFV